MSTRSRFKNHKRSKPNIKTKINVTSQVLFRCHACLSSCHHLPIMMT